MGRENKKTLKNTPFPKKAKSDKAKKKEGTSYKPGGF